MQHLNTAVISNEQLWHRRFCYIGKEKLKWKILHMIQPMTLVFVKIVLMESIIVHFFEKGSKQVSDLVKFLHSDVCGKIRKVLSVFPDIHRTQVKIFSKKRMKFSIAYWNENLW